MKDKRQIEIANVLAGIDKNLRNKKWICFHPGCNENAINSHLLQKNGILNSISENGHVYEAKVVSVFRAKNDSPIVEFTLVGINEAFSFPLFCNKHDTELFKTIESSTIDYENYFSQMLFTYRAVCAELRKKEKEIERFSRILNSNIITSYISNSQIKMFASLKEGFEYGARDLFFYKSAIEKELLNSKAEANFCFSLISYPRLPVCVSSTFSPTNAEHAKDPEREKPFEAVFINIIPTNKDTKIIVGYHDKLFTDWIPEYVASWMGLSQTEFEIKLTNLIITRIETWAMAPEVYESIDRGILEEMISYINNNTHNLDENQHVEYNIFSHQV